MNLTLRWSSRHTENAGTATFYKKARCHIPEDSYLHIYGHENRKSHKEYDDLFIKYLHTIFNVTRPNGFTNNRDQTETKM